MNQRLLVRRLVVATVIMAILLSGYAILIVTVFRLRGGEGGEPFVTAMVVAGRSLVIGTANIGTFLFCYRQFAGRSERKRQLIRLSISAGLCLILFSALDPLIFGLSSRGQAIGHWNLFEQFPSILLQTSLNFLLVVAIHEITILNYENSKTLIENSELKAASAESAYLLLRQQTHPHFLFNALSMLRSLYKRDVGAGDAYLAHLVNFLRASLTDNEGRLSPVRDEIALCDDYIAMQKIRFDKALSCDIQIPDDVMRKMAVPAFSVQSLIENAIKHNEITDYAPLYIKIYYRDGRIITENNIQPKTFIDTPSRKGLANLRERYRLISDEKVVIQQENGLFSVSIKVLPYEDRNH